MEQRHQPTCLGSAGGNVGPFEAITAEAGVRQIRQYAYSTMLFANNVIGLVWNERGVLGDTAVLATARRKEADSLVTLRRWLS
jgi:hypothetical protein